MLRPSSVRALVLGSVLLGGLALAEPQVATQASPTPRGQDDAWQVRLRYGVAVRSGAEQDQGPGLSYSGLSPNDLALSGWLWLLLQGHLGLTVGVQREAFSLLDAGSQVTSGGLLRAHLGPTGRVRLGPARLEAAAAYLFQQLPVFGTVSTPTFAAVSRHGVLLAARGLVDLGPVTVEGRFEYPLALAHGVADVRSRGLGVGGGLRVQLVRTGDVAWGAQADVTWHQDQLESTAGPSLAAAQSVVRAGLALDLKWQPAPAAAVSRTGRLVVEVRDGPAPLPGVVVALTTPGGPRDLATDAAGRAELELPPGEVAVSVAAEGYERAEARASLTAGEARTVVLALVRPAPTVGALQISVVSFEGQAPVAASLEVNGKALATDAAGVLRLEGLAPGPVAVKASAPGFQPQEEAASVVAGATAALRVVLVPEKKRVPATLSGFVRSARGGAPLAATLEIRELKQTLKASTSGAFSTQVLGGKYTVRISADGFTAQTKSVVIRDGDQSILNVDLSPK